MVNTDAAYTVKKQNWANLKFEGNKLEQIFEFSQLVVLSLYNKKLRISYRNKLRELICIYFLCFN